MRHAIAVIAAMAACAVLGGAAAKAQTLKEALVQAYETNYQLSAARAGQRATDELLPQAKAYLFRPQVTLTGEGARELITEVDKTQTSSTTSDTRSTDRAKVQDFEVKVDVPLYRGGRTFAEIDKARANILSGQAGLLSTEQGIFNNAITAYANVVFYRASVAIQADTVHTYEQRVRNTEQEVKAQRRTVAELALFRNGLASAQRQLATAKGELQAAEADYAAIIGAAPGKLQARPALPGLPKTFDQALKIALKDNPDLRAAAHNIDVEKASVRDSEGELLPQVDLVTSLTQELDRSGYSGTNDYSEVDNTRTLYVGVQLTMNLYEGGGYHSAVREAKQKVSQAMLTHAYKWAALEGDVKSAWARLTAAHDALKSAQDSVAALNDALTAMEFQFHNGDTTTSDLIDYLDKRSSARITLESAYETVLTAESTLLQAVGSLNARGLDLPVKIYDPNEHLRQVKDKWFGLGK